MVVAAAALRFPGLGRQAFYWDESMHGMSAMMFLQYGVSPWLTLGQPPVYTYATSIWVHLAGASELAVRLTPAIAGTLTVPLVYALGKIWYDRTTGLAAALLLTVLPVHVLYSRTAFSDGLQSLFVACSILCFELSTARHVRGHNLILLALSGFLAALAFLTKLNSIALQGLYLLSLLLIEGRRIAKFALEHLAWFAGSILVLAFGHYRGLARLFFYWTKRAELDSARGFVPSLLDRVSTSAVYWLKVLFTGLSPLVMLLLGVAFACGLYRLANRSTRYDRRDLPVLLSAGYLLVLLFQGRLFVRYILLILPYFVILIAGMLTSCFDRIVPSRGPRLFAPRQNVSLAAAMLLVLASCVAATFRQVKAHSDFAVYREVGGYLRELQGSSSLPGRRLYVDLEYPLKFYLGMWATPSGDYGTIAAEALQAQRIVFFNTMFRPKSGIPTVLEAGDVVVFSRTLWNRDNLSFMHFFPLNSAPLEEVVWPSSPDLAQRLPEQELLDAYLHRHFELLRTFAYQSRTFAWVYRVTPYYDKQTFVSFLRDISERSPEPPGRLVSFAPWVN